MNSSKIISRLFAKKICSQARKSHGTPDKYTMKAARCYLEGHAPYTDIGYDFPMKLDNPYGIWLKFFIFFGSGFWMPFASYHYHRVKNL